MKKPGHLTQKTETNARVFATNTPDGLFRGLPSFDLMWRGLDGVAVVSALFAQPDVKAAAEEMLRLSRRIARP